MNLAIVSPNQNAYSETFIQAHKNIPGTNVKFYFGGGIPKELEGKGSIMSRKLTERLFFIIRNKFFPSGLSCSEEYFMKSLKNEKIQCVLAEYGSTGVRVMPVCKKLKIPLIVHFHGWDASADEVIEKYGNDYKEVFNYASAVMAVSRVMEQKLLNLGCPRDKLVYNTYGPNNLFFDIEPAYSNKLFIGIGRFVDKKAPYYTILAFYKVLSKHPDAKLVLAGDGQLFNTCNNLVRFLKIEDSVSFPGVIKTDQFADYLKNAQTFVQHSVTALNGDMEGTPVAVLEASAAGLPVISTLHAGIPDVILNGETGLLVEEHDVDGMAENMIWVLDNPEESKLMGLKGKHRMKENFSMERHLRVLREVIVDSVKDH